MNSSKFGALAAAAVLSLVGASGVAYAADEAGAEKACYRTECGKSVKGHQGKCGGTKVDGITTEETCTTSGGAWTTAAEAEKYKKKM